MDPELEKIKQKKVKEMLKKAKYPETVVQLTGEYFYNFIKEYEFAVVDCWATWCMPCYAIAPIVEELAKRYQGKVAFGKLNVDNNQEIMIEHGIRGIPTLLIFKNGELVDRSIGAVPINVIEEKIKAHLE